MSGFKFFLQKNFPRRAIRLRMSENTVSSVIQILKIVLNVNPTFSFPQDIYLSSLQGNIPDRVVIRGSPF